MPRVVPSLSIALMLVTALLCVAVPVAGWLVLQTRRTAQGDRRYPKIWRPLLCGAWAWLIAQPVLRIPLLNLVVPQLPQPLAGWLQSAPALSLSAGLFEETARLVVMLLALKGFCRWADAVAFGLGHGGLEAIGMVGATQVSNVVFSLAINQGRWDQVASQIPPAAAAGLHDTLVGGSPWLFGMSGVERVAAITVHIGCSLLVLAGIYHGRRLLGWGLAVLLHSATNLAAALLVPVSPYLAEAFLVALAVVIWLMVLRARPRFAASLPAAPAAPDGSAPAPGPDQPR